MADLIFVAVVVAFFALSVAFVRACDRLVGPDGDLAAADPPVTGAVDPAEPLPVAS